MSMSYDELKEEITKDFRFDKLDLGGESLRCGELFVKYIKLYSDAKYALELMENRKKALLSEKREYYSGAAPAEVYKKKPFDIKVKTDAGLLKYIEGDADVISYNTKIIEVIQTVDLLHACLQEIKNRNFQIKNAIEMLRFMSGA